MFYVVWPSPEDLFIAAYLSQDIFKERQILNLNSIFLPEQNLRNTSK